MLKPLSLILFLFFSALKCQHTQADVIFLLDASDNVGEEQFKKMKGFIGNFARLMEV